MRLVVQRVSRAGVVVEGVRVSGIGVGYLALVGAEEGDTVADARCLADKLLGLRVFEDADGKMNRSIVDVGGGILLVSQFTLRGDARHGRRPSFSRAARPEVAEPLLGSMREMLSARGLDVQTGRFGAHMEVELTNDGPVTILLDSRKVF